VAAKDGNARIACVVGDPIAHSLSPRIHEYWLARYDINGAYIPLRVPVDQFEATLDRLFALGCVGMNVTLPHKRAAYEYAHKVDAVALETHAVNTLVMKDGIIYGYNSDVVGFSYFWNESLAHLSVSKPKRVMLLGAGGAASAIITALRYEGCEEVMVANRTVANAHALVEQMRRHGADMRLDYCSLDEVEQRITSVDALVNSVAIGALDETHYASWFAHATPHLLVLDASYARHGTPLTRVAQQHGCVAYDGLPMLLGQATLGFEHWFGVCPEIDADLYHLVRS
jgi:shikimate dehydrogenase